MRHQTEQEARAYIDTLVKRGWRVETDTGTMVLLTRGKPVNHVLHLILTCLTLTMWLPIWILMILFGGQSQKTVEIPLEQEDAA